MEIDTAAHIFGRRIWIRRLKNGLAVEHPIASDELRAIKRYLAIRRNALPWLSVSKREQPLARQSVNYLIAMVARRAELPPVHRTCCDIHAASISPIAATTCGSSRTTSSTEIRSTLSITRGSSGTVSKASGDDTGRFSHQRPIWRLVTRLFGLGHVGWICAKLAFPVGGCRGCLR